jgi:hypothetical protein
MRSMHVQARSDGYTTSTLHAQLAMRRDAAHSEIPEKFKE